MDTSPVIGLNRAVAVSKVRGPEAGLQAVTAIQSEKPISSYYLLHAVLADLKMQLGNFAEASDDLRNALALTSVQSEQAFLKNKLTRCEVEQAARQLESRPV